MATAAEIQAAYKGIARADLNATVAASIAASGITLDAYIAGLIAQQASTTGAAVAITSFITGVTPSSAQLDALKVAADAQVASYTKLGVGNPALGAFEAFGRGLATDSTTTATFNTKYGALSTADFITSVYVGVYGTLPSAGATANLTAQINYFTTLYTQNNVPNAALAAKGAVLGQIVGYAFTDANAAAISTLDNSVATFLSNVAKGDTTGYGKALPATTGTGTPGAILTLTVGADTFTPDATNSAFKTTANDDTIRGNITDNSLETVDVIDGGAGVDTLNVNLSASTAAPVLRSVENIFVTELVAATPSTLSLADATGVQQVWNKASVGALNITNVNLATTIGLEGAVADTATFAFANATGTNDTATLAVREAAVTATKVVTIAAIENLNIVQSDIASTATNVTTIGSLAVADTKSITLTGTGSFTVGTEATNNFAALTKFDASGHTGNLTVDFNAGTAPTAALNVLASANGVNTITLKAANGLVDTVTFTSANVSTLNKLTTVANFNEASQDKLDLKAFALGSDTTVASTVLNPAGDVAGFFSGTGRVVLNDGTDTVYVDINKDGNFNAATDLAVVLTGVSAAGFTASDLVLV